MGLGLVFGLGMSPLTVRSPFHAPRAYTARYVTWLGLGLGLGLALGPNPNP